MILLIKKTHGSDRLGYTSCDTCRELIHTDRRAGELPYFSDASRCDVEERCEHCGAALWRQLTSEEERAYFHAVADSVREQVPFVRVF